MKSKELLSISSGNLDADIIVTPGKRFPFLAVCEDVTKTAIKIPQGQYLSIGRYPIYDQGKELIGGFCNNLDGIANDVPYIVFGDHTRVLKFVDTPCFIGADGVKLLKVTNKAFLPKYVYYSLLANPVENQGYSRHFKLLKEAKIKYASPECQEKAVHVIDAISSVIEGKQRQLTELGGAVKSLFNKRRAVA